MNNFEDKKNYYDVLEVAANSTLQDIHSAYVRTKNAYAGDSAALYSLMSNDECEKILNQIEEAYSIIGVPEKRREYDQARGYNQNNTPEGFTEEFLSKPNYAPLKNLSDSYNIDNSHEKVMKENALKQEYQYQKEHSIKDQVVVSKTQAANKFGLSFQKDDQFEQEIENTTHYTGEFLQKIRDYKKVTVERMAEMTKISKTYIRNIEGDEFSKLPADVYTRGFVYQYAKCLKLNSDLVATSYIQHLRELKNPIS